MEQLVREQASCRSIVFDVTEIIIIINNDVFTVYQKTNACIVMSAKHHWYPCSRPQWMQQITGNALQIFLQPDEKIDNGSFFN